MYRILIYSIKTTSCNLVASILPLFKALKLWSLNLMIPLFACLISLLSSKVLVFEIFRFWLVEGLYFHILIYVICLLTIILEEVE